MNRILIIILFLIPISLYGGNGDISVNVETEATFSGGSFSPLWLTNNKYGMSSADGDNFYLRAGAGWDKSFGQGWKLGAGLDLATAAGQASKFWLQQAYFDVSWSMLSLSIGSKERIGSPLEKDPLLTSGWMAEGINTRPIPQIRAEIRDFYSLPFTGNWLSLKGHLAYGAFLDGNWQESFATTGQAYARDVKYHSKALMLRIGNKEKFPAEFEVGLHMATQFCGDQMRKMADGSSELLLDMPDGFRNYINAFFPSSGGSDTTWGEQVNVEGNMLGSWNFAVNYYFRDWKFRLYLDHYFEDHSQLTWQYGRWRDGQLGLEIDFPKNRWVSSFLWETISTKDQTGPLLYDGFAGSFSDLQMSGCDSYYCHYIYQSWQYYGMGIGLPLLPGSAYNEEGSLTYMSNRMKANHFGLRGNPAEGWSWRVLASIARHWGTYSSPFDNVKHQFSGLAEVRYNPPKLNKWTFKAALGIDNGDLLGNSVGGTISVNYKIKTN